MEKENLLELKNVRKVFGQTVALDSVSFTLYPGEIHGLLGGNGAGKTTLMNVLYGLYRKDDGDIILHVTRVTDYWQASVVFAPARQVVPYPAT